ncbi:unnamed protein product, partial [Didymodactylos carnosus]
LQCYEHDLCINCPDLAGKITTCSNTEARCWKLAVPLKGIKRGCGENRCNVQVDTGIFQTASVCCNSHLCNSAPKRKNTFAVAGISVIFSLIIFYYH